MDGNFRLCRRKKAGEKTNYKSPLTTYQLFASQPDVDLYVNKSPQLLQGDSESDKVYILVWCAPVFILKYSLVVVAMP